jgi:hypothetical protein
MLKIAGITAAPTQIRTQTAEQVAAHIPLVILTAVLFNYADRTAARLQVQVTLQHNNNAGLMAALTLPASQQAKATRFNAQDTYRSITAVQN